MFDDPPWPELQSIKQLFGITYMSEILWNFNWKKFLSFNELEGYIVEQKNPLKTNHKTLPTLTNFIQAPLKISSYINACISMKLSVLDAMCVVVTVSLI